MRGPTFSTTFGASPGWFAAVAGAKEGVEEELLCRGGFATSLSDCNIFAPVVVGAVAVGSRGSGGRAFPLVHLLPYYHHHPLQLPSSFDLHSPPEQFALPLFHPGTVAAASKTFVFKCSWVHIPLSLPWFCPHSPSCIWLVSSLFLCFAHQLSFAAVCPLSLSCLPCTAPLAALFAPFRSALVFFLCASRASLFALS